MILCVPQSKLTAPGIGGCPDGYAAVRVGEAGSLGAFVPLELQAPAPCTGMLCEMPVQDVGFAALIVLCFAVGFAAGFVRR